MRRCVSLTTSIVLSLGSLSQHWARSEEDQRGTDRLRTQIIRVINYFSATKTTSQRHNIPSDFKGQKLSISEEGVYLKISSKTTKQK